MLFLTTSPSPQWLWGLTPEVWLTIAAIIAGPILAVQAEKWIERSREHRGRRVWLFRELMATRGTRLSPRHVEALNIVELEYHPSRRKEKKVYEAWRSYFDALKTPPPDPKSPQAYYDKRDDLFVELLYEMGKYLGFDFDRVAIRRNSYSPQGHGDMEEDLNIIRKGLAKVFTSESYGVPVRHVGDDFKAPPLITPRDFGMVPEEKTLTTGASETAAHRQVPQPSAPEKLMR